MGTRQRRCRAQDTERESGGIGLKFTDSYLAMLER